MTASETLSEQTELAACLNRFRDKFNDSARVKKLIKGWNRDILIEATDSGDQYTLVVADLAVAGVEPGRLPEDPLIHLQALDETLQRIFYGRYNPAHALIDGNLAVFSDERDKVKLEAIAMVLWGL